MKAIIHKAYGNPTTVLHTGSIDTPSLGPADILIRVHACSIGAGDWHVVRGTPFPLRFAFGLFRPKYTVPGNDFSGVVEKVGPNVTTVQPGDAVFGDVSLVGLGAFAEHVRASEDVISVKPENVTFEEAAASPGAGLAALQGLRDTAGLRPGQHVLINSASGGVGSFAVQIAKHMGARVTGVCSTRNVDFVTSLGADDVIDYTREDFGQNHGRYDVIFDAAAYRPFSQVWNSLTPNGTYVFVGGGDALLMRTMLLGPIRSRKNGRSVKIFMARANVTDLQRIAELLSIGAVKPYIERVYPFDETPQAIAFVERGRTRGKIVVTI